jgi:hypothetical protein
VDGGPDDVARGRDVAADDGRDLAGLEEQSGEIEGAPGRFGSLFGGPALGLPLIKEEVDELVLAFERQRVDDGDGADLETVVPGDLFDSGRVADEPGLGDLVVLERLGRLQGPRILRVGEGDPEKRPGGLLADVGDERVRHRRLLISSPY